MECDIGKERRQSKRVPVGDGLFVCFASPIRRPWQIIDIGSGGLSFRYITGLLQQTEEVSELEIVTRDTCFSLEQVPFKWVSDIGLRGKAGSRFEMRRCGISFGALTQPQTMRLHEFISRCSTEAP